MTTSLAARTSVGGPLVAFSTVAAMLVSGLLLTNWPIYSEVVLGGRIPLHYYVVCYMLAALVGFGWVLFDLRRFDALLGEPLVLWFVIYVVLGYAWLQFSPGEPSMLASYWRMRVLALLFFLTGLVISTTADRKWVAHSILAAFIFATVINWFDFFNPGLLLPLGIEGSNPGRGAGLFINPNISAVFVMMAPIAVAPYLSMRFRGLMFLVMVLGVIPTFSRFGIVFMIPLIVMASRLRLLDRRQSMFLTLMLPGVFVALASVYGLLLAIPGIDVDNLVGRVEWFSSVGRELDSSGEERLHVAELAIQMFVDNPALGAGLAATYRVYDLSSHNIYLVFAAEQGVVGLVVFLVFILLLVARGLSSVRIANARGRPADQGSALLLFALLVATYGVFSHNVLEHPFLLLLLGFVLSSEENRPPSECGEAPVADNGQSRFRSKML